jgi:hypothetical protein
MLAPKAASDAVAAPGVTTTFGAESGTAMAPVAEGACAQ